MSTGLCIYTFVCNVYKIMWSCPVNMPQYYPGLRDILPEQDHINIIIILSA